MRIRGTTSSAMAGVVTAGVLSVVGAGSAAAPAAGTEPEPMQTPPSVGDTVVSAEWGDVLARQERQSTTPQGDWAPARDAGSMTSLTTSLGIQDAWARGLTGKHVTVALIDTGVAPMPGLTDRDDKLVNGPDLSFDGQWAETRYVDAFGHGTHLAGIIAGRDEKWDRRKPVEGLFTGVAPDAQLLNVKVGAADGGADVSQVIAALDWVVQHRREGGTNVRVICLAYGTASPQPWQVDPLAHAVEAAWRAGIVVVTSAGNDGLDAPNLLMPAVDPHVLAVGAVDPVGTASRADDVVADFSNGGSSTRRPDVVAPGRSIVSLRVPGSYADTMSPEGRITGDGTERFFRGSGTSQATAFVAGQVALLLEERPKLTPDQVKALLVATARPLPGGSPAMGAGVPDVLSASQAPVPAVSDTLPFSTGLGSLEASRGGEHVVDPVTGAALTGEVDALGSPWDPQAWATASSSGTSWQDGAWNGRSWTGHKYDKKSWLTAPWTGTSWAGVPWDGRGKSGSQWEARSWRGQDWKARSWRKESWKARSWRALF